MNSLILISPSKAWGFQPILSGKNFPFSLDTSVLSALREGEDLTIFDVRSKYTI